MAEAAQQTAQGGLEQLGFLRLDYLCKNDRFRALDSDDALYSCKQYVGLRYNWNGDRDGYGDADISPGWFVPFTRRVPSIILHTAKFIVNELTSMMMGEDRSPDITVEGDSQAEDYVKALAKACSLNSRMTEARNKGGSCGSVALSFAFVDGKPRVQVHRSKHTHVQRWADRYEFKPAAVLKTYCYQRAVLDPVSGKVVKKDFYYARYWDEDQEIIWDAISKEHAENRTWVKGVKSYEVRHEYGECPVVWIQNKRDGDREEGESDYAGQGTNIMEMDRLASATTKGTVANVDPTLVIKEERSANQGAIRKGSDNAIYAKGGAMYLELKGDSVRAAKEQGREIKQGILDTCGVVSPDAENVSGAAKSAAAMRIIYRPMTATCDNLREQYGEGEVRLLTGMLRAAKKIQNQQPGEVLTTSDGRLIQQNPTVVLPDRVETLEDKNEEGELVETTKLVPLEPGISEQISLNWPAYFQDTAQDESAKVDTAVKANGTLISEKTAIRHTASLFGVTDLTAEQAAISAQKDASMQRMSELPNPDADEGNTHNPGEGQGE